MHRLPKRLINKIEVNGETGCWVYTGKDVCKGGYHRISYHGHKFQAHRLVYELLVGTDIRDKQLDHLCEVRACVNPKHLDPCTPKVNCNRKYRRRKKPT